MEVLRHGVMSNAPRYNSFGWYPDIFGVSLLPSSSLLPRAVSYTSYFWCFARFPSLFRTCPGLCLYILASELSDLFSPLLHSLTPSTLPPTVPSIGGPES